MVCGHVVDCKRWVSRAGQPALPLCVLFLLYPEVATVRAIASVASQSSYRGLLHTLCGGLSEFSSTVSGIWILCPQLVLLFEILEVWSWSKQILSLQGLRV